MKPALPRLGLFLLLTFFISCKHPIGKTVEANFGFTGDSGYISDAELFKKIKFDTISGKDTLYQALNIHTSDTIGKYYKGSNGHYFSCLNASQGHMGCLLVETLADGSIVNQQIFGVGVHDCCWNGSFDGFRKYGDYISFRSCTTGTAVCGGAVSLFKTLKPQDDIGYISESLWYAGVSDTFHDLTSTLVIKNDTVYMRYTNELYTEQEEKRTVESTAQFTIRYANRDSRWIQLDSTTVSLGM
ncbi:hypothetical protein ACLI09_05060 [Flavobacterium sp. RHBU_24]|uniref:hypothetical protein n=1 Tax=Flavobacterium sp. RHBU_24 TaxID=3391185 RepID=UPI003984967E